MVEAQTSVPYAIVGGILALLVFLIICVLVGMVWCSVRQKGEWGQGLNSTKGGWLIGKGAGLRAQIRKRAEPRPRIQNPVGPEAENPKGAGLLSRTKRGETLKLN